MDQKRRTKATLAARYVSRRKLCSSAVSRNHASVPNMICPCTPNWRVNWLSSCGTLFQDDVARSFLRIIDGDPAVGELAVVVRDPDGGVAWRVWPIRSE